MTKNPHLVFSVSTACFTCLGARWPLRWGIKCRNVNVRDTSGCVVCRQRPCLGGSSLQAFSFWGAHPLLLQEKPPGRRFRASVPSGYFSTGEIPLHLQQRLPRVSGEPRARRNVTDNGIVLIQAFPLYHEV